MRSPGEPECGATHSWNSCRLSARVPKHGIAAAAKNAAVTDRHTCSYSLVHRSVDSTTDALFTLQDARYSCKKKLSKLRRSYHTCAARFGHLPRGVGRAFAYEDLVSGYGDSRKALKTVAG